MAIYHCDIKIVSRGNGKSAISSVAYMAGEKLQNERFQTTHDYRNKTEVVMSEISLPENAPQWMNDRSKLWNSVERIEKSKDAQLARKFEMALPRELNREQQIELIREYVKTNFVDNGMIVDWSLHDKNDGNPHVHGLISMRPLEKNGDWGAKCKKEYMLDENGDRIKLKSGQWKSRKIDSTNWNTDEMFQSWCESAATITNKHLDLAGHDIKIDHRSLKDQGIDREPQIHVGVTANDMEKKQIINGQSPSSDRGNINREILQRNSELAKIRKQIIELERQEKQIVETEKRLEDLKNVVESKPVFDSVVELDIQKRRESFLKHENEKSSQEFVKIMKSDFLLIAPYINKSATEIFSKQYAEKIAENKREIEKYNADVAKHDNASLWSKMKSSYNVEAKELEIRKTNIDNRQLEIQKMMQADIKSACTGSYKVPGNSSTSFQDKINSRAEEIARVSDPQFENNKRAIVNNLNAIKSQSAKISAELSSCRSEIKSLESTTNKTKISRNGGMNTGRGGSGRGGGLSGMVLDGGAIATLNARSAQDDKSNMDEDDLREESGE
jgi:hypothetical protein